MKQLVLGTVIALLIGIGGAYAQDKIPQSEPISNVIPVPPKIWCCRVLRSTTKTDFVLPFATI